MKRKLLLLSTLLMLGVPALHATISFNLSYNSMTGIYTISINSTVAYNNPLSRFTPSTQFTIVAPDPDGVGPGAFSPINITNLTALNWGFSQINSPVQNPTKDYITFAPSNAGTYTPFNIAANTNIPLFTFMSAASCVGTLSLYDNVNDPFNANLSYDVKNNIKILGAGNINIYSGNTSGPVPCPGCTLTSLTTSMTPVSCFGGTNGTATATPVGTAPYTYLWSNAANTQTATGLAAGAYTVTVTDNDGCTGTAMATVTQPAAALAATISAQTNVACFGGTTGSATVTPTGGTTAYTYLWPTGAANQTTATASNLAAGAYVVTVTDARGCTTTSTATITQPAAALTATISAQTNVLCFGGTTGSATVTGAGGTGAYTYAWPVSAASQTTATASNLAAGAYVVTVKDANNCTATATATITQPAALAASTSHVNVGCGAMNNGTATATASGGTPAYTYLWSNGGTTATITGLSMAT